jgi:hypothetical protein
MSIAAALGCMVTSSAIVSAQQVVAVCNIPFSFQAESQQLAAGRYTIARDGVQVGTLASAHGGMHFLLGPQSGKTNTSHLTFYKYGHTYFLKEVVDAGGRISRIPSSAKEREIASGQEQAAVVPTEVTLLAQR